MEIKNPKEVAELVATADDLCAQLEAVTKEKTSLEEKFAEAGEQITELTNLNESLSKDLDQIKQEASAFGDLIDELTAKVEELTPLAEAAKGLEGRVATLEGDLSEMAVRAETAESEAETLRSQFENLNDHLSLHGETPEVVEVDSDNPAVSNSAKLYAQFKELERDRSPEGKRLARKFYNENIDEIRAHLDQQFKQSSARPTGLDTVPEADKGIYDEYKTLVAAVGPVPNTLASKQAHESYALAKKAVRKFYNEHSGAIDRCQRAIGL